jgi:hypothetical protein
MVVGDVTVVFVLVDLVTVTVFTATSPTPIGLVH